MILTMQTKGTTIQFEVEYMKLDRKILDREFKPIWKQVKKCFKKGSEKNKRKKKKDSNSTEKRKYKVKYTINKTKSLIYGSNRI